MLVAPRSLKAWTHWPTATPAVTRNHRFVVLGTGLTVRGLVYQTRVLKTCPRIYLGLLERPWWLFFSSSLDVIVCSVLATEVQAVQGNGELGAGQGSSGCELAPVPWAPRADAVFFTTSARLRGWLPITATQRRHQLPRRVPLGGLGGVIVHRGHRCPVVPHLRRCWCKAGRWRSGICLRRILGRHRLCWVYKYHSSYRIETSLCSFYRAFCSGQEIFLF